MKILHIVLMTFLFYFCIDIYLVLLCCFYVLVVLIRVVYICFFFLFRGFSIECEDSGFFFLSVA